MQVFLQTPVFDIVTHETELAQVYISRTIKNNCYVYVQLSRTCSWYYLRMHRIELEHNALCSNFVHNKYLALDRM